MSDEHIQKNTCPSNTENDQDNEEANFLHFDLLTLNDRKTSFNQTEMQINDREIDGCCSPSFKHRSQQPTKEKKIKLIHKKQKEDEDDKKISMNRKRRITFLERRVDELEREISSFRRNQHFCHQCRNRLPDYYREGIEELIQPEELALNGAGDYETKRHSKDSLEFEKIDFHTPLMQTREMQEKMWIFVGTMLIAMGSKIMDFDGTINIFKVLKQSVDKIRRQVQKCQPKLGLQFYCLKEQLRQPNCLIDGMNFDPFYSGKQELGYGNFSLQGVKLQSVQEYELIYDVKYNFNIKYDTLLTIMEYARDHCSIS